ncbi:hypothetical protein BAE44_0022912 [Dichanthelium oligosanthes]|uniref:HMA domain-containing protein n=1 Tax=Dichanthelium oligosanthes TaxID=888268 RepID=A0A1E5UTC5_9POAL|nr:hypothetical protein BAE44_0022912 [Dichanthelium oligosanthes]
MAPVILRMDVHCYGCAGKIRKVVKNLLGVEEVWVSVDTGLVVVAGTSLDASLLRWKIQMRTKRPVAIVSDGVEELPPPPQPQYALPPPGYPHYSGMVHLGPQHAPYAQHQPPANPYYGAAPAAAVGWVPATAPSQHMLQYVPSELLHARHQYMPNEAPLWLNDENPNGCCSVQ